MPHLTVEFTNNLAGFDEGSVLAKLNAVLAFSGQFEGRDIKSRALPLSFYRLGNEDRQHGFIHVTMSLLSGREPDVKKKLADQLLTALKGVRKELGRDEDRTQLTVDVRDIDREVYAKG